MQLPTAVKVSDSLQQGLNSLFGFIPNLIGFFVILIVGYFIAKLVKSVIAKLLDKVGLDDHLHSGQTGEYVERVSPGASPSRLIAGVVFWFIFLFVLSAAIGALKIPAVTAFMNQVLAYLPNVIVAVLIFVVAGVVAAAVAGLVAKTMGDTPTGKVVASVVPALVMGIAIFMILNQLRIAPEIVQITYTALIGALALGLALAFGLGGREVAAEMLRNAYQKGQEQKGQVKADMQKGKERAQDQAASMSSDGTTGARPAIG
jgi:small-conductance mechanosensitive channel